MRKKKEGKKERDPRTNIQTDKAFKRMQLNVFDPCPAAVSVFVFVFVCECECACECVCVCDCVRRVRMCLCVTVCLCVTLWLWLTDDWMVYQWTDWIKHQKTNVLTIAAKALDGQRYPLPLCERVDVWWWERQWLQSGRWPMLSKFWGSEIGFEPGAWDLSQEVEIDQLRISYGTTLENRNRQTDKQTRGSVWRDGRKLNIR